jgi:16S rRNA (cytosine1402-N4)-methyltransferase
MRLLLTFREKTFKHFFPTKVINRAYYVFVFSTFFFCQIFCRSNVSWQVRISLIAKTISGSNAMPVLVTSMNVAILHPIYLALAGCIKYKNVDSQKKYDPILHGKGLAVGATVHVPILVAEVMEAFALTAARTFLDATLGGAGHTTAILQKFPQARLWAMDRDLAAIERARTHFPADRVHLCLGNFSQLDCLEQKSFDGILFDFGLSSDQLDAPGRGFSFRHDGPLDMRMDPTRGISAAQFLRTATMEELVQAVRDFGEEPCWRRIVNAIWEARGTDRLDRTLTFADLVREAVPRNPREKIDSATRTFQGIRIAVNGELDAIREALPKAFDALNNQGVIAVISFHSLEDRPVKQLFRHWAGLATDRHDFRYQDERISKGKILTSKPITPSAEEIASNPRSRSAKLRIFRKEGSTRP